MLQTQPIADFRQTMGAEPVNILLVDDRPENLVALEAVLGDLGQNLVKAGSGPEALRHLLQREFAVVLLDVQMPEMDGFETAQLIRSRPKTRHTPVIFVTAISKTQEHAERGYSLGAVDYVFKPVVPEILRTKVAVFVELQRKTEALEQEVDRRRRTEADLRELSQDLERRVEERTSELATANWELALAKEAVEESLEKLRQLESMRDDLTHMIVHDLRTPLTSLLSGLETLDALGEVTPAGEEFLAIALQGGRTLLGMINDLLDISKLESGELKLDYSLMNPSETAKTALGQVALLARERGIQLELEAPSGLPSLLADEGTICRVLVNLLGNALKFTPAGGGVALGIRSVPDEAAVQFFVTDTGEGIPESAFERIFEKFGQVAERTAGRKMSTGLGLTFCKMAVEAHGGRVSVQSRLGEGSVFSVLLPLRVPEVSPA